MRDIPGDLDDSAWFDEQLYSLLAGLCGSDVNAMAILKNAESGGSAKTGNWRGAVSWYKLAGEVRGRGDARREELRELVVTDVPRASGYSDTMTIIETWEKNLREYELLEGRDMPEQDKIMTIKDMIPLELKNNLNALEKDSYPEAYAYIARQTIQRKEEEKRGLRKKRAGGQLGMVNEAQDVKSDDPEKPDDGLYSFQRGAGARGGRPGGAAASREVRLWQPNPVETMARRQLAARPLSTEIATTAAYAVIGQLSASNRLTPHGRSKEVGRACAVLAARAAAAAKAEGSQDPCIGLTIRETPFHRILDGLPVASSFSETAHVTVRCPSMIAGRWISRTPTGTQS